MRTFENRAGVLFIGDPHVCSTRIGRRKDDYLQSVLGKLEEAAALCHEQNLHPVILGDLLHRHDDNSLKMLNRLARALQKFPVAPDCLGGNHDKGLASVSESDALDLLALGGFVVVCDEPGVFTRLVGTDGAAVNLFGVPFGHAIPGSVGSVVPADERAIVVTHHDLAFGSAYPGAQPLKEITGAFMLVNGHMHATKPSVTIGGTRLHNPGNIEPLSIDLLAHVPKVWSWALDAQDAELVGHALSHAADVFDLTGVQVAASDAGEAVAELGAGVVAGRDIASQFADMMASDVALDAGRTDDGSILKEDLQAVLEATGVSEATQQLFALLAGRIGSGSTTPAAASLVPAGAPAGTEEADAAA